MQKKPNNSHAAKLCPLSEACLGNWFEIADVSKSSCYLFGGSI